MPGTDRRALLEALWRAHPDRFNAIPDLGYAATRPGARALQLGPVIASDEDAGLALLDHTGLFCAGQNVYVDIPNPNAAAMAWARARGLAPQRVLIRMCRGNCPDDRVERIFASAGPEKG
jgi:hypothetical protein